MKFLINLIELYAIAWFAFKALRLLTGRRGKGNKSITGKIFTFASRGINHRLDVALKKQREKNGIKDNVIPFKKKAHGRV
jgi:hypothetical protein